MISHSLSRCDKACVTTHTSSHVHTCTSHTHMQNAHHTHTHTHTHHPPPHTLSQVHLDCSHNQLTGLPFDAAQYWMHSLERLYLSHNTLTEISRSITDLTHISTLDLSYNKIKYLPPTSWWTANRVNKLNLSHNLLSVLSHHPEEEQSARQAALGVPQKGGSTVRP